MAAVDPRPGDVVVEIGAGKGVLTAELGDKAGRAIAVEKDERLIPGLRVAMPANVEIVPRDIHKINFHGIVNKAGVPRFASSAISPIPFRPRSSSGSWTSAFFFRIALLLHKEVAERVTRAGHEELRPLGILLRNGFEARVAFTVAPGCSRPRPRSSRPC